MSAAHVIRLRSLFESCGRSHISPKRISSVRSTSFGAKSPSDFRTALGGLLVFISSLSSALWRVPREA